MIVLGSAENVSEWMYYTIRWALIPVLLGPGYEDQKIR